MDNKNLLNSAEYFNSLTFYQNIYIKFSSLTDDKICIGFIFVIENRISGCMISEPRIKTVKNLISSQMFKRMFDSQKQYWNQENYTYFDMLYLNRRNGNSHVFYEEPSFINIKEIDGFKTLFEKYYNSNEHSLLR